MGSRTIEVPKRNPTFTFVGSVGRPSIVKETRTFSITIGRRGTTQKKRAFDLDDQDLTAVTNQDIDKLMFALFGNEKQETTSLVRFPPIALGGSPPSPVSWEARFLAHINKCTSFRRVGPGFFFLNTHLFPPADGRSAPVLRDS